MKSPNPTQWLLDWKDEVVFITGATSGFGLATARRFAQAGAKLILLGRREERLVALAGELGPERTHLCVTDVRDHAAVQEAVQSLPPAFQRVSLLVNNAGLAVGRELIQDGNVEDWETVIDTNIKGLLYCVRAVVPGMMARGGGHVVNIGSVAGTYPYPGGNVYGGTKAFVEHLSLHMRADLLGKNIRVTNIAPGMAETEFSLVRYRGDEAQAKALYVGAEPLLGEDLAEIIYFVASAPAHVNINRLEVMPTRQAFGPFVVHREDSY